MRKKDNKKAVVREDWAVSSSKWVVAVGRWVLATCHRLPAKRYLACDARNLIACAAISSIISIPRTLG